MVEEDEPKNETEILRPAETWRVVKNVVVIGLAFMVHFIANNGTANLQSSINAEAGLGTASLATVYAGLIFSNMFLPAIVIKCLSMKWTICLSFITYMPYIAAQFKPTFYTLIPAGLIVGLGGGPLWCAKCTYLSVSSRLHSKVLKISTDLLFTRFMGLFIMLFSMNQVWGNLISSLVLSADNAAAVTSLNASLIPELCGANFLPSVDAEEALPQQPPEKMHMIIGIYLCLMVAAALIVAVGVDPIKRDESERESESGHTCLTLLSATMKLQTEPNQILLVFISIFCGLQAAFLGADFTAGFVSCAIGTGSVGYVMMTSGIADIIGCILMEYLVKVNGRCVIICSATIIHLVVLVTVLIWRPQADLGYVVYIIAGLWGLCDSVWIVQICAFYRKLFPGREEGAFSSYRFWESLGYIISYVISPYFRTSSKTYLLIVTLVIGFIGYLAVEVKEHRRERKAADCLQRTEYRESCSKETNHCSQDILSSYF